MPDNTTHNQYLHSPYHTMPPPKMTHSIHITLGSNNLRGGIVMIKTSRKLSSSNMGQERMEVMERMSPRVGTTSEKIP